MSGLMRDHGLAGLKEIAGILEVTSNQVHMWHKRRAANDFPAAVACIIRPQGGGPKGAPLFDLYEVVGWHQNYDVKAQRRRGAAPKGNQYASGRGRAS